MSKAGKSNIVIDNFVPNINKYWNQLTCGGGIIRKKGYKLQLGFDKATEDLYTDAQLDDYTMYSRRKYPWSPPLKLTVRAKFTFSNKGKGSFQGTAGFGFWNNPFSVNGTIYAIPESIWFFYASSRSYMILQRGSKGSGWKAQVVHAIKPINFLYFFPTALFVMISKFTNNRTLALYWIEKFSGTREVELNSTMDEWHTYSLIWQKHKAEFFIDKKKVMETKEPPSAPLGFVIWVDNQFSVISTKGSVKFGKTGSESIFLEVSLINIESL